MRTIAIYFLAAVAASACRTTSGIQRPGIPEGTESSRPPAPDAREAAVRARMQGHERLGDAMRDAVARGDLDEAKAEAKLLAKLRIEGPSGALWRQMFDAMRTAAAGLSGANDLNEASRDVAMVAKTCGDCHTMFGRPGVIVEQANARASGVRALMQRHQWAAERLWDGLVVPSDDAWRAGAVALAEAPLAPEQLTPGKSPGPKVGELEQAVHQLGQAAANTERVDVRVGLYGQALATCAECHKWLGGGPSSESSR